MGEMAEDAYDRVLDELYDRDHGYRDSYEDMARYSRTYRDPFNATCKHCGMTGLKWRAEAEGWRLFEDERIEHNRLKPHDCRNQCSADDFDVIPDDDV